MSFSNFFGLFSRSASAHLDNIEDQFGDDLVNQDERRSRSSNSRNSGSNKSSKSSSQNSHSQASSKSSSGDRSSDSHSVHSQPHQVSQPPVRHISPGENQRRTSAGSNSSHSSSSLSHPFSEEDNQRFQQPDDYEEEEVGEDYENAQQFHGDPQQQGNYDQYQGNNEEDQSQAEEEEDDQSPVRHIIMTTNKVNAEKALRQKRALKLQELRTLDLECQASGIPSLAAGGGIHDTTPNPHLEATTLQAEAARTKKAKRARDSEEAKKEKERLKHIKTTISGAGIWRVTKFILSEDRGRKVAMACIKIMKWVGTIGDEPAAIKGREDFVDAYWTVVIKLFNEHRTYVNGEIKKVFYKWWLDHGNTLPTVAEIKSCLDRTVDIEDDDECELFEFYWNCLIPKACGNMQDWDTDHRYYMTISKGAPPGKPNEPYVTPSTEAYILSVYQSNRTRWLSMFEIKKKFPSLKQVVITNFPDKYAKTDDHVSYHCLVRDEFFY